MRFRKKMFQWQIEEVIDWFLYHQMVPPVEGYYDGSTRGLGAGRQNGFNVVTLLSNGEGQKE